MKSFKLFVSDIPIVGALVFQFAIFANLIFVCSDTYNYLLYPIPTLKDTINPDALFYFLKYFTFLDFTIIHIAAFFSITLFFISTKLAYATRSSFFKLIVFTSPFILSLVGLHLWSCAIKSGLSLAFITLASVFLFFHGSSKSSYYLFLIFLALGLLIHWSSLILILAIVPCYYFHLPVTFRLSPLVLSFNRLRFNFLTYISLKSFLALLVFSLLFGFSVLFFSGIFSSKFEAYDSIFRTATNSYGRFFPLLSLYQSFIFLLLLPSKTILYDKFKLLNFCKNILLLNSIFALLSLTILSALTIRVSLPLQFIASFLSYGFFTDKKLIIFVLANVFPYLYYIFYHFISYPTL